jgi:spore maturation protein CgeB
MASGTPVVCRYVPGLENEFIDGTHCMFWRNHEELLDRVRWLLEFPESALSLGAAGRLHVNAHHTWNARIRQLAPMIESMGS